MAAQQLLQHYLEQARHWEQAGQPRQRDRFLVLALDIAWQAGKVSEAEQIWQRLRMVNPHHLLVSYSSLQQALTEPVIQQYLLHTRSASVLSSEVIPAVGGANASPSMPATKDDSTTSRELLLPLQTSLMQDSAPVAATSSQNRTVPPTPSSIDRQVTVAGGSIKPEQSGTRLAPVSAHSQIAPAANVLPLPEIEKRMAPGTHNHTTTVSESQLSPTDRISPWVAGTLAVLVLTVGLVLLAYVVLIPFLFSSAGQ